MMFSRFRKMRQCSRKVEFLPRKSVGEQRNSVLSNEAAKNGIKCILENNFIGGVHYFSKALRYNPDNYAHYLNRSYCYLMTNKYPLAFNDAKYVIQNSIDHNYVFVAYLRSGLALCALGEYQKAEVYLQQANDRKSGCSHYVKRELLKAKVKQLVQMGFCEREAILALQKHSSTKEAMKYIAINSKYKQSLLCYHNDNVESSNNNCDDWIYSSDEDGVPSNTDLVNTILQYTPGVTKLDRLIDSSTE